MSSRKSGLGVDIGASSFKSAVVGVRGGRPVLLSLQRLKVREEGILNEADLYASLASWLERTQCLGLETTVGLPQYLATTQLSDFPQGASSASLEEMVAFETQQLAGLSEESFVHDFHVLPPGGGRSKPVLIGICRESVIRDRVQALRGAGIEAPRLGMDGLAVVNALLCLEGDSARGPEPQIVVDIGRDHSTLVVTAGGHPLFVTSLLFGAGRFVQAAAEREGIGEAEAEAHLAQVSLSDESPRSAYVQAARQLESEIGDAIGHWRAQERPELAEIRIARAWLCGGGARLEGLPEYLADDLHCPAQRFGPTDPAGGVPLPEMAAAFGLAMQSIGAAPIAISLTPEEVRREAHRERRFPFLVAACVLFGVLLGGLLTRSYLAAKGEGGRLEAELAALAECEKLIPRLEGARRGVERCEAILAPLVQAGNRSRRAVEAVDALFLARGEGDWFVYLGDAASYHASRQAEPPRPETETRRPGGGGFPGGEVRPVVGDTVLGPEFPVRALARQAPGMDTLIAAGYTPLQRYQQWEPVRTIIENVRATGLYANVELLQETERVGREDIFEPWVRYFRSRPGSLFKPFSLRLSLAGPDVAPAAPPPEGRKP
ncbi:MAG: pilus assembly protein PilM [Lentisphaeria bacterium]|nr:pilus assembly protein PilM [Lentisphaeria bacterium]